MDKYKDELTQYFIKRKDYLDLYYYSIIKIKNKALADEIYIRIKEKESTFEEIAKKYSEGPEKRTQGERMDSERFTIRGSSTLIPQG